MTRAEAEARVARGAALLDEKRPGWAQRIDAGTLDLAKGCHCILGQLETSFTNAVSMFSALPFALALDGAIWTQRFSWTRDHGFEADLGHERLDEFRLLQDAWIAAIADRLVPSSDVVADPIQQPASAGTPGT